MRYYSNKNLGNHIVYLVKSCMSHVRYCRLCYVAWIRMDIVSTLFQFVYTKETSYTSYPANIVCIVFIGNIIHLLSFIHWLHCRYYMYIVRQWVNIVLTSFISSKQHVNISFKTVYYLCSLHRQRDYFFQTDSIWVIKKILLKSRQTK